MSGSCSLAVLTEERDLLTLRQEWRALWLVDGTATPFGHPDWQIAWWRAFHPGDLRVFAVRVGPELIALAPLYLETSGDGPRLMPVGVSLSDYTDVLVHPDHPEMALRGLAAALISRSGEWRHADWDEVAPSAHLHSLRSADGLTIRQDAEASPCPVLALPSPPASLSDVIPARRIRKVRMARNRLERRAHRLIRHTAGTSAEFVTALEKLHTARWQSRGETGVFSDGALATFLSDALPGMMTDGLAQATTLMIGETLTAAYLGFRQRGMACAYMGGFDPAFAFESPGTVLLADAIECAMRDGASEFHFLRGPEPYKYEWGAIDRVNRRVSLAPASP